MKQEIPFDFWYAVNNTEIVKLPSRHLETFGTTSLQYHMISELMDSVDQIRVRQGRMIANKPEIIAPEAYAKVLLEGFGDEAARYLEWLREHEKEVRVLQYGYRLKQEAFSENIVTDNIKAVVDRVQHEVKESSDPFTAILVGVDKPWDVCLVKLFWEIVRTSAHSNVSEMVNVEIEAAFLAASRDSSRLGALSAVLHRHGVFERYEDRFFATVKTARKT